MMSYLSPSDIFLSLPDFVSCEPLTPAPADASASKKRKLEEQEFTPASKVLRSDLCSDIAAELDVFGSKTGDQFDLVDITTPPARNISLPGESRLSQDETVCSRRCSVEEMNPVDEFREQAMANFAINTSGLDSNPTPVDTSSVHPNPLHHLVPKSPNSFHSFPIANQTHPTMTTTHPALVTARHTVPTNTVVSPAVAPHAPPPHSMARTTMARTTMAPTSTTMASSPLTMTASQVNTIPMSFPAGMVGSLPMHGQRIPQPLNTGHTTVPHPLATTTGHVVPTHSVPHPLTTSGLNGLASQLQGLPGMGVGTSGGRIGEHKVQEYEAMLSNARWLIKNMSSTIHMMQSRIQSMPAGAVAVAGTGPSPSPPLPMMNMAQLSSPPLVVASPSLLQSHLDCTVSPPTATVTNAPPPPATSSNIPPPMQLATTPAQPSPDAPTVEPTPILSLRPSSAMERVWYVDRPFPSFTVQLTDNDTAERVSKVSGWKVAVSLVDGYGCDASDKLSGAAMQGQSYAITKGVATITGLRFCGVSSKAGGSFQLVIKVVSPQAQRDSVECMISQRIQVLSYRLYHSPKVPMSKLRPDDSVAKMKGIGSLYAKRFAALGISRVEQMAAIDVDALGEDGCKKLLDSLRKDRGAMTLNKLSEYIVQARGIVARFYATSGKADVAGRGGSASCSSSSPPLLATAMTAAAKAAASAAPAASALASVPRASPPNPTPAALVVCPQTSVATMTAGATVTASVVPGLATSDSPCATNTAGR